MTDAPKRITVGTHVAGYLRSGRFHDPTDETPSTKYHHADLSTDLVRAALEVAATRARDWVHGDALDMPAETDLWDYIMAADPAAIVAQVVEKE